MKYFKHRKQAKGGSGTVTTTIELPEGVAPAQVTITTEGHGGPGREALHAHELTAADTDFVRLVGSLVGQNLPNECPWVLPSGKVITAAEMRRWTEEPS